MEMIRNKHIQIQYFTILLYLKCGLIRGASLEGEIQMFFTISMHMKCGFLRGVVSLKGTRKKYFTEMWVDNRSFAFEMWANKMGIVGLVGGAL